MSCYACTHYKLLPAWDTDRGIKREWGCELDECEEKGEEEE